MGNITLEPELRRSPGDDESVQIVAVMFVLSRRTQKVNEPVPSTFAALCPSLADKHHATKAAESAGTAYQGQPESCGLYGSSGKGGALCIGLRKSFGLRKKEGVIKSFITGEDFSIFSDAVLDLPGAVPELRGNPDLGATNEGVTILWLK